MAASTRGRTKAPTYTMTTVPPGSIEPMEGLNPRTSIDRDSDAFAELVASVKARGVLQPILVTDTGNGKRRIVAGARRWAAASEAKLKEVPIVEVSTLEGAELDAAIAENVHREDLSPMEEARAVKRLQGERKLKQAEVAKALGKSERWVRGRLALLRLPDKVQGQIEEGAVPVEATGALGRLTKVAPELATVIAAAAVKDEEIGRLDDDPVLGRYVTKEGTRRRKDRQLLYPAETGYSGSFELRDVPLAEDKREKLEAQLEKLQPYDRRLELAEADVDAARAYGCLAELPREWGGGPRPYITDAEWLADRAEEIVKRTVKAAKKRERDRGKVDPGRAAEAEARQKEAEERAERRASGIAEMRSKLQERLATLDKGPSLDEARLLVLAASLSGDTYGLDEVLIDAGEIEPYADGGMPSYEEREEKLAEWVGVVLVERSVERLLARGVRILLAGAFRGGSYAEPFRAIDVPVYVGGRDVEIAVEQLIERVATSAKVLPQAGLDGIKAREKDREAEAKAQAEAEAAEQAEAEAAAEGDADAAGAEAEEVAA